MKKIIIVLALMVLGCTAFAQSFYIEGGYLPTVTEIEWPANGLILKDVFYVDLGFGLEWKVLFLNGNIITWMVPRAGEINFNPFYTSYTVDAGVKIDSFTVGFLHTCMHPVAALGNIIDPMMPKEAAFDKLYIRWEVKF